MVRLVLIALLVGLAFISPANICVKNPIEVKAYPNPFFGQLKLALNDNINKVEVEIRDILGKVVYHEYFENVSQPITLETTSLNKGVYILNIQSGSESVSQRILRK